MSTIAMVASILWAVGLLVVAYRCRWGWLICAVACACWIGWSWPVQAHRISAFNLLYFAICIVGFICGHSRPWPQLRTIDQVLRAMAREGFEIDASAVPPPRPGEGAGGGA